MSRLGPVGTTNVTLRTWQAVALTPPSPRRAGRDSIAAARVARHPAPCRRSTSLRGRVSTSYGTEAVPASSGDLAGHARHADPANAAMGPSAWLRDRADHPQRIGRVAH